MAMNFAFENGLTGKNEGGGGNFPKVGHAYKATIREVEFNKGWYNIYMDGINFSAGDYACFSHHENSNYINDWVERIANNLIASNKKMEGAIGMKDMDISKWGGKGLEIGVVYGVRTEWDGSVDVETKWASPKFSIPISEVDEFVPDVKAYNDHQEKFWSDDAKADAPKKDTKKEETKKTPMEEDAPW